MPRTLSTRPVDSTHPELGDDLDNRVADGLESLRQRIRQRLQFRVGEWTLDTRKGTESVLGHGMTPTLAASVISSAIRDEGGDEVTGIVDVEAKLDRDRVMRYTATVTTIYGAMLIEGTAV